MRLATILLTLMAGLSIVTGAAAAEPASGAEDEVYIPWTWEDVED